MADNYKKNSRISKHYNNARPIDPKVDWECNC